MILGLLNAHLLFPLLERVSGRRIIPKLRGLRRIARRPFAERRRWQRERLVDILELAGRHVPYWRDLYRRVGFEPAKVADDPGHLRALPCLTKQIIREQGGRMLNETLGRGQLERRKTGGSTGPSADIFYSRDGLDWTAAVHLFVREWIGKKRRHREIHLAARFPERPGLKFRLIDGVKFRAQNRRNILIDSLDDEQLERMWRQIRRARARLIQGHPSTLYALCLYLKRAGVDARGAVPIFESTGEAIDRKKRSLIEEVLGCRVINRYGSAEFGVAAYEGPDETLGRMRLLDFVVHAETVPADGGQQELVLTGLLNPAMPMLRYRTGDLAELVEDAHGLYMQNVSGRLHDLVAIGGRSWPTHYIQDRLDRLSKFERFGGGVDDFQIEVGAPRPILRLVPMTPSSADELVREVGAWWPDQVQVECVSYDELRRVGRQNKFRYVVEAPPGDKVAGDERS